ncbi:MAG: hypothetical protein RIB93_33160 [Coleofasciculus sp. D1-CHI-01]|uniref:hypothetical protein n=1 Tax=Coleofasciculus sp. D1-CHI-01 TaxID=3068482 RepID=UPI0033052042
MTQYIAHTLAEIYEITAGIDEPKAIIDFISGEMGNEVLLSQSLGGKFYDKHHNYCRVIALTWEGCGILYSNISHDQIELVSPKIKADWNKNRFTTGENRFNWLTRNDHDRALPKLPNIKARLGPYWVSCGMTLGGYSNGYYFAKLKFQKKYGRYWHLAVNRLARTQPTFDVGSPLVEGHYISLFDRHDRHNPQRNTQPWHIQLFKNWANKLGIKFVVISDFYPRKLPENTIRFQSPHRDLKTIANVANYSLLHAAPASGSAEVALVFGCHFVQLCDCSVAGFDLYNPLIFARMSRVRGYEHFGVFNAERRWLRRWGRIDDHNQEIETACSNHLKMCLHTHNRHVPTL